MTSLSLTGKKQRARLNVLPILCLMLLAVMLLLSEPMKAGAIRGLSLSLENIIPTLFPFFILSDLWLSYFTLEKDGPIQRIYEKAFGISSVTLPAYILGNVCGFPLGISTAVSYYNNGLLSKDELERLSAIANNPSAAFVISGIGIGLYRDFRIGLLLYFSTLISSILIGIIFRSNVNKTNISRFISRQKFNLVDSIKKAGLSSITLASYIVFFSSVIGLVSQVIKDRLLLASVSALLEITNASSLTASLDQISPAARIILTAFALGFSGFSVHMQGFLCLPPEASKKRYLLMKLMQGILSSLIVTLPLLII